MNGSNDSFWRRNMVRLKAWNTKHELLVLVLVALVLGGLWAFAAVADEVVEGETHRIDRAIILMMRTSGDPSDPVGPDWVEELGRDITALGGMGVLIFLTIAVTGYLVLEGQHRVAGLVFAAIASGMLLNLGLKEGFDRPRPELVPYGARTYTSSFPSGHSMMSALTYLTLGALLARIHPRAHMKIYFLALALFLTIAVGISRVYLGVHWPTDVLAGWASGGTWAVLCWLLVLWLQQREEPRTTGQ